MAAETIKLACMRKLSGLARGQLSRGMWHLTALSWSCSGPPVNGHCRAMIEEGVAWEVMIAADSATVGTALLLMHKISL